MMKYSQVFIDNGFKVDILVDNATTHTKALVDISMFSKSSNRACPLTEIKWFENGIEKSIDCFFRVGNLKGQSKGLFQLCKELGIVDEKTNYKDILLRDLRERAVKHPAINHISVLENFVDRFNRENKMDIKIIHVPKFHCELNPIEMYWAFLKYHFRKFNDQTSNEEVVIKRILEAREDYAKSDLNFRLFSRFWRITQAYSEGKTYATVMKEFFNAGTELKSHRKITKRNDG